VPEITRSQYAIAAIDAIFRTPIFSSSEFYELSGMPRRAGERILQQLREQEIIAVLAEGGGRRRVRGGQGVDEVRVFEVPQVPGDAGCGAAGGRDSCPQEGREETGDSVNTPLCEYLNHTVTFIYRQNTPISPRSRLTQRGLTSTSCPLPIPNILWEFRGA